MSFQAPKVGILEGHNVLPRAGSLCIKLLYHVVLVPALTCTPQDDALSVELNVIQTRCALDLLLNSIIATQ
jgi:hypothetical protein